MLITRNNFHNLKRIQKRLIPFFPKNRFDKVLEDTNVFQGYANSFIRSMLETEKPFMAARLGSIESRAIINYLNKKKANSELANILLFLSGKMGETWLNSRKYMDELSMNAGFFPNNEIYLNEFVELMLSSCKQLDLLGVWNDLEKYFPTIPSDSKLCKLRELEPWFYEKPWSADLAGKKVLVVHPFEEDIRKQYNIRTKLFKNPKILPEFDLKTIKAVQTIAGEKSEFATWFDALNYMKTQIDQVDFDVAIIGCGAYGFPLASYIKEIGKQAIHLGGATQLLFGIKGKRWEEWQHYKNLRFQNGQYWISPTERPKNYINIENGCYW